jgi:hypothetical protein
MEIFRRNELGKIHTIEVKHEHLFLGTCCGVALVKRGPNDNHICFIILTEDDENWFVSNNLCSTYWLPDLEKQLIYAKRWIIKNAEKDTYGYRFKE